MTGWHTRIARWPRSLRWGVPAAVAAVAATAVGFWAAAPDSGPAAPRARHYAAFDACLLTGPGGVSGSGAAAAVWSGMQAGSLETSAKVSYVSVIGTETSDNVVSYLNTLIVRRCDLVLAVGPAEAAAVAGQAPAFPSVRFAVVGSPAGAAGASNVARIDDSGTPATSAKVRTLLVDTFHGRFAPGPVTGS